VRLNTQLAAVRQVLSDGRWRTIAEIHREVVTRHGIQASEASISSRVRDLRKSKFGAYQVGRRYIDNGLWAYCMETIA
jgi:hypothetical protein